jgi:hypothetical protein
VEAKFLAKIVVIFWRLSHGVAMTPQKQWALLLSAG